MTRCISPIAAPFSKRLWLLLFLLCVAAPAQASSFFPPGNAAECTNAKQYLSWEGGEASVQCDTGRQPPLPACASGEILTSTDGASFSCIPALVGLPSCSTSQVLSTDAEGTLICIEAFSWSLPSCGGNQALTSLDSQNFTCTALLPTCPTGNHLVSQEPGNWACANN